MVKIQYESGMLPHLAFKEGLRLVLMIFLS
jgi:hypothetical protein